MSVLEEETVGQRVRRLRLERGLTQKAVAGSRVTSGYVSRIEHGDRRPSVAALRAMARALDVTPALLETGLESPLVAAARELVYAVEQRPRSEARLDLAVHAVTRAIAAST